MKPLAVYGAVDTSLTPPVETLIPSRVQGGREKAQSACRASLDDCHEEIRPLGDFAPCALIERRNLGTPRGEDPVCLRGASKDRRH
jgi:hypothetical protein